MNQSENKKNTAEESEFHAEGIPEAGMAHLRKMTINQIHHLLFELAKSSDEMDLDTAIYKKKILEDLLKFKQKEAGVPNIADHQKPKPIKTFVRQKPKEKKDEKVVDIRDRIPQKPKPQTKKLGDWAAKPIPFRKPVIGKEGNA